MGHQANQVREDILDRVLTRSLLPGERVDEADLMRRLGLSGTPIREALISLEAVGVVERRPRDGARITTLDLEGLIKSVEVLAETEAAVAYRAARRINKTQAKDLEDRCRDCLDFAKTPDRGQGDYYDLNIGFHRALIAAAANEYLEESVYLTSNRLIAYLAARHALPGEPERSAEEHSLIRDAVLDANGDLARDLMLKHIVFSDTLALDVFNAVTVTTS